MHRQLKLVALAGMPLVKPGDDLAALITQALEREGEVLRDGDVLVVAQKIISKAENQFVSLEGVVPSSRASELAKVVGKDARLVEVILRESTEVLRYRKDVLIVRHRSGHVCANAGVDQSNVGAGDGVSHVLLLPKDSNASASALRSALEVRHRVSLGVIVNDTAGRAWRVGLTALALGVAGVNPIKSYIGDLDLFGRPLEITQVAVADELASAASLLMGQAAEATPVVLVRGAEFARGQGTAQMLIRPLEQDLFR